MRILVRLSNGVWRESPPGERESFASSKHRHDIRHQSELYREVPRVLWAQYVGAQRLMDDLYDRIDKEGKRFDETQAGTQ